MLVQFIIECEARTEWIKPPPMEIFCALHGRLLKRAKNNIGRIRLPGIGLEAAER